MAGWAVTEVAGEVPLRDDRLLSDSQAAEAWNIDLNSGRLEGLADVVPLITLPLVEGLPPQRAYRFPSPNPGVTPDVWLGLPSPFSSVVRGPLANDTLHRIYWTNPGEGAFWTTYDRLHTGLPPYDLGTIMPDPTVAPTVVAAGGTLGGTIPLLARSYIWTYVDTYGEESAPSAPSAIVTGASDGTWTITGLPTVAPANPLGKNYPPIVGILLYRTTTGASTGGQFFLNGVWIFGSGPPVPYHDTTPDAAVTSNPVLPSASWANPPAKLDGLVALQGGMLVGFTDNTLHFCEPDRPHAWPPSYDLSARYDIVAMDVWQNSLIVLTQGFPSTGAGSAPAQFVLQTVHVSEPCIARGSVVSDLLGVYYASPNGLVMLNYYGMTNTTQQLITRNQWTDPEDFNAAGIIATRYRSQYLTLNTATEGRGFLIDFADKSGVVRINTLAHAVCVWSDPYSADAYIMADSVVYRWNDGPDPLVCRWRSKRWILPAPVSLGAAQVIASPDILTAVPAVAPLDNGDARLVLPTGVNALFRLFADGSYLVLETPLTKETSLFRIPGGFKSFDWQIEIVTRVPIFRIEVAPTMKELRGL